MRLCFRFNVLLPHNPFSLFSFCLYVRYTSFPFRFSLISLAYLGSVRPVRVLKFMVPRWSLLGNTSCSAITSKSCFPIFHLLARRGTSLDNNIMHTMFLRLARPLVRHKLPSSRNSSCLSR
ncbi:hypothetical protein VNO78_22903 [Psophocarpus tetragonolobus]|uniref:Uncharacterized protein n=1 Tax=Psophocarpus tetragonolobus TaxID=3891 RepID=A0AAN9S5Q0_PSOTE